MSTLSMRLKQRARMLAAGVALSAATLALIPGVAEATDPTDCVCRLVGDIANTEEPASGGSGGSGGSQPSSGNSIDDSIGAVQLADGLDANNNNVASNNQTNLLTNDSSNNSTSPSGSGGSGGSSGGSGGSQPSGGNSIDDSIGAVQATDVVDANRKNDGF